MKILFPFEKKISLPETLYNAIHIPQNLLNANRIDVFRRPDRERSQTAHSA
jgi:hypothetical protein